MRNLRRWMLISVSALAAASVSACKPTYEAPVNDPIMTTAPADAPYDMDFDQLNDDVINSFSKTHVVFPFVKSMEISGNNDTKNIEVDIDIQEGVADYAVQVLLSDVTKKIDNNAYIQDFRIKQADDTQFGSVYDIYSYTYKVTCGKTVLFVCSETRQSESTVSQYVVQGNLRRVKNVTSKYYVEQTQGYACNQALCRAAIITAECGSQHTEKSN